MTDVTISLVGANGDTITLADDGDYVLLTGARGFGMPAAEVRIDPSTGDGGVWRSSRRGVRDLDLPIAILGLGRDDVETKLRRLARLLQDTNGATRIVANYSDGSSVYLDAHFTGGAETQFGEDAGLTWCRWVISLQAPQPYWQTGTESSFSIGSGNTGRSLLPKLASLKVSSSQTLGLVTVNNTGDVPAYPRWVVKGPVVNLVITDGTRSFSFPGTILQGKTYTIDTLTATVKDELGTNLYSELGTAPKLFSLLPGTSTITVTGDQATADTSVVCYYSPRYEVVH